VSTQSTRSKRRFRRPASWDNRRGQGLHIALAAAEGRISMPPGLWHVSDYAARELAHNKGVKLLAAKHSSGEPFLLLLAPDGRVLGLSAESDEGLKRVDLSDPSAWANRQTWRFGPHVEGVAP
jgi:hypothetical protein